MTTFDPTNPGTPAAPPPLAALSETIYSHLRAIAQRQMNGERQGHTLSATALVNEAYIRLQNHPLRDGAAGDAEGPRRAAFVHAASEAMRRILIEHARMRATLKRGGERTDGSRPSRLDFELIGEVADLAIPENEDAILAFDDAFERLGRHDPRFAEVVRLRFFAGLSVAETALTLGVSERTVNNDWAYARAWLARELHQFP